MKHDVLFWARRTCALGVCAAMLLAPCGALAKEYRNLKLGSEHSDVSDLQQRLLDLGYYTGRISGHYGELTENAVIAFQKANNLDADGIAGQSTQELLFEGKVTSASSSSSSSSSSSTSSSSSSGLLKEGSKGDDVRALQNKLKDLGYYKGSVTGNFGNLTAQAVMDFQRKNGLSADGIAGKKTLALLNGSSSSSGSSSSAGSSSSTTVTTSSLLKEGSKGDDVLALQKKLKDLGYYSGSLTGNFGNLTAQAVMTFQRKNGLSADGIAGAKTLAALNGSASSGSNNSGGSSSGSTTTSPNASMASRVQHVNWYTMRGKYPNGTIMTVYDPATGYSWNLSVMSKDKHCDTEPVTADDTNNMYKAFLGLSKWTIKPVWVTFPDGNTYIAATYTVAHGTQHNTQNNFNGHICVHFPLSMDTAEGIGDWAVSMQKAIIKGWDSVQKMAGQ